MLVKYFKILILSLTISALGIFYIYFISDDNIKMITVDHQFDQDINNEYHDIYIISDDNSLGTKNFINIFSFFKSNETIGEVKTIFPRDITGLNLPKIIQAYNINPNLSLEKNLSLFVQKYLDELDSNNHEKLIASIYSQGVALSKVKISTTLKNIENFVSLNPFLNYQLID